MRLKSAEIRDFKRFTDISITDLPPEAKLIVLVGPNGSGKSSLFEAFNYWMDQGRGGGIHFKADYHIKCGTTSVIENWSQLMQRISLQFHNCSSDPRQNASVAKKAFYFRSAYRHEPEFIIDQLKRSSPILEDSKRPVHLINSEQRVSDNYKRLVSLSVDWLYDPANGKTAAEVLTGKLLGRVREAMGRVFHDLILRGPGKPLEGGTFLFEKGASVDYLFANLSGGEKAAFDLLLDFVVKTEEFNDTIFCLDEPELHMHTRLQAALLNELLLQMPSTCQLWIATHSIGMARRAMELHQRAPNEVIFLDFAGRDFDATVKMQPRTVDRLFWKEVFEVALDDLANLVAPSNIVFCEGSIEFGSHLRNPSFDASVFRTIFSGTHPDTEFVPLGGVTEVEKQAALLGGVFRQLFSGMGAWTLYDRDDRSSQEIADLQTSGGRVLSRRDLENFLWDDEVINTLATRADNSPAGQLIIAEKNRLLNDGVMTGAAPDDVKRISGPLYNFTKSTLCLTGCGNNARSFARDTLAPLILPGMQVFRDLERDVFPPKEIN